MKKICLLTALIASFSAFSQGIFVDTSTYTPTQLINQVLINSPCVSGSNVVSSTGSDFGSTNGIGYFTNINPNFPFASGVVLTTGDVSQTPSPNTSILSAGTATWPGDADLEANLLSQSGVTINSINASYIQFDFQPKTANFDFNFIFASEEYGASQCNYSDAFAFLLTDITAGTGTQNLALVPPASANIPISVATIRNSLYNSDCPSQNAAYFGAYNGTGYGPAINFNGQTVQMVASAAGLNTTHIYRIKIVIADGANNTEYDSAIFLEANSFNIGQNVLGPDKTIANGTATCPGQLLPVLAPTSPLDAATTYNWQMEGSDFTPPQTAATLDLNVVTPNLSSGQHTFSLTYTEPSCVPITDEIIVEVYPQINAIAAVADLYKCDNGGPSYTFDFTGTTAAVMAGLPANTLISYHDSLLDAQNDVAPLPTSYPLAIANNNKTIFIRIKNPDTGCYTTRSFALHIVAPPVIAAQPADITLCARNLTDSPPKALFNLKDEAGTPYATVLGGQDSTYNVITFHSNAAGANSTSNNTTSLFDQYFNASGELVSNTRTLYIRIQNISNPDCFVTTTMQLTVLPLPQVDVFPDVYMCTSYTLPALTFAGSQYRTGPSGTGTQYFPGNVITNSLTLNVYNTNGVCSAQDTFKIIKVNVPSITPPSASYCTQYTLPSLPYGNYFTGVNGSGTQLAAGSLINTPGANNLHVYFTNPNEAGCAIDQPFAITIIPYTPLPEYPDQFACTSYTIPPDANGATYYTGAGGSGTVIAPGTVYNIPGVYTVHVYKESGTSPLNCNTPERTFNIYIGIANITPPTTVTACSSYTLPALTVGEYRTQAAGGGTLINAGTPITSNQTVYFYVPGQSCTDNVSFDVTIHLTPIPPISDVGPVCDIFYLPAQTHAGNYYTEANGGGTMLPVGYPIIATQQIWFRDVLAGDPSCSIEESFTVTIESSPPLDSRPVREIKCNSCYTIPALVNGKFYAASGGPTPSNLEIPAGQLYCTPGTYTLFIFNGSTTGACDREESVEIVIADNSVNDIVDMDKCDTYLLEPILGNGAYYTLPGGPSTPGQAPMFAGDPITTTTTLYVYSETIEDNRRICYDEESFTVTIHQTPVVQPIAPASACDSFPLPALVPPATAYYQLPGGPHTAGNVVVTGPITSSTTLYAFASTGPNALCYDEEPFSIAISNTPAFVPAEIVDRTACDSYTLLPLTVGNYFSNPAHTVAAPATVYATTTIYVYAENPTNTACNISNQFVVNITNTPTFSAAETAEVFACDSYVLPAPTTVNAHYYDQPSGMGNIVDGNTFTGVQTTVYLYAINGACPHEEPKVINVFNVEQKPDGAGCGQYQLPPLSTANTLYYTQPGGLGTVFSPGDYVSTSGIIYIHGTNSTGTCSDETFFQVTNYSAPEANDVTAAQTTLCDLDGVNDGVTGFDLDSLTPTILGAQDPLIYGVAYYETLQEAAVQANPIVTDLSTGVDTTLGTVYVRLTNTLAPSCFDAERIVIFVVPKPDSSPLNGTICIESQTGEITPAFVQSGYSSSYYNFEWRDANGNLVSTAPNLQTTSAGTYTLNITSYVNGLTGCDSGPITVTVIKSGKPADVTYTTSGWFTDLQTIEVTATPIPGTIADFVYSLDGGTPQTSSIFTGVSEGAHEITVMDVNGCGSASVPIPVQLVYNPKYFTPNGDGINDTWTIAGLEGQPGSEMFIYDKYGKFIKQMNFNSGEGWDGTYNGRPMPADDYWFSVSYIENGAVREYKSHFSLIR